MVDLNKESPMSFWSRRALFQGAGAALAGTFSLRGLDAAVQENRRNTRGPS